MKITENELEKFLKENPGWEKDDEEIEKIFEFPTFPDSIIFVDRVAEKAESANHHPEIKIDYNKVKIELSTHDEDGITEKDTELAREIDSIAQKG